MREKIEHHQKLEVRVFLRFILSLTFLYNLSTKDITDTNRSYGGCLSVYITLKHAGG